MRPIGPQILVRRPRPHVLCADDEPETLQLLTALLERAGMEVTPAVDAPGALALVEACPFDLVVTDMTMSGLSGHAFLSAIRARDQQVPIVVVTGQSTMDAARHALREGVSGLVLKPFTASELLREVEHALEGERLRREALQFRLVGPILDGVALALSAAIEARDLETAEHCQSIGVYGERIAASLGLDQATRTTIRIGGYLHDVGKIGIADRILLKRGPLTEAEFREMRRHPLIGADILAVHEGNAEIAAIVRHHHERWDGAGYPSGMLGSEIPIGARIVSVADAFSAMTTDRPYRAAIRVEDAWRELRRHAGRQFDPAIVQVFAQVLEADREVAHREAVPA